MTRHPSFHSSLRTLAASELDLIVGGAGKQDTLSAAPYLPGGGFEHIAVGPPAAGAADGPGFTWPSEPVLSTVNGAHDGLLADGATAVAPPLDAHAADGAGFTWPADWQDTLEARGDDAADSGEVPDSHAVVGDTGGIWDPAGGDAWADTFDPHQYVTGAADGVGAILPYQATETATELGLTEGDDGGEPPHLCGTITPGDDPAGGDWADSFDPLAYADGVESLQPYQVEALPDQVGLSDDVGADHAGLDDILPYQVEAVAVDGDAAVTDDDGGGCHGGGGHHGDGGGHGDGSGRGDGSGGHCHDGGGCDDDGGGDDAFARGDGVGALSPYEVVEASPIAAQPIHSQYDWAFTPGNLSSLGGAVAVGVWSQFASGAVRR